MALTQVSTDGVKDGSLLNADINASAAIARTKLANVDLVDDTSPQLGGDLDTNSFEILLDDNHAVKFGNDTDLTVLHSGSTGVINNVTGDLFIKTTGSGDDIVLTSNDDIELQPQAGEDGIKVIGNGAVELYYDNSKRLQTEAWGTRIFATGQDALLVVQGEEDRSATLRLQADDGDDYPDYSQFHKNKDTGKLHIQNLTGSDVWEDNIVLNNNGAVELYHDNSKKSETRSDGLGIEGDTTFQTGSRHKFIGGSSSNLELGTYSSSNSSRDVHMSIDSAGNVSIGSTSNVAPLNVRGMTDGNLHVRPITSIHSGTGVGLDVLNDANNAVKDLAIRAATIVFRNASAEIARTNANGLVVGSISFDSNNSIGVRLFAHGTVHSTRDSEYAYVGRRSNSNGGMFLFRRDSTDVGNISVTTSATSYNSGSDYRLKQDDTPLIDGLTRLKQLKPIKFKWKNDTSQFVDGFFAHEVSSIVPNAITGEKDAVYEKDDELGHKKGDPIYQQIDHGKLVPLLVAALQEEIVKREELEARVAALEAA
jgi:hypothetical protein